MSRKSNSSRSKKRNSKGVKKPDIIEEVEATITSTEIDFPTFNFVTDKTKLTRSLRFSFNDFSDFSDLERKVTIDANFTNSRVHFGDLMHFIKSLNRSSFFLENKNETLAMSGRVSGTIDRLQGRDMNISIGDDFYLNANFSTRNLTQKNTYDLASVSPKMAEAQDFFVSAIQVNIVELEKSRNLETEKIIESALDQLEDLEDTYKTFIKELNKTRWDYRRVTLKCNV